MIVHRFLSLPRDISRLLQVAASLATVVFLTLFTHRIFHPDTLANLSATLTERATYPNVWLAAAFIFLSLGCRLKRTILTNFGYGAMTLALLFVVAVQVLLFNPLWTPDDLGHTIIFNLLLYSYGLPALLAAALALWLRRQQLPSARAFAQFAGIISLLLLFVLTTLEIRHAFQGPILVASQSDESFSFAERATYPALWILLAFPLLAFGRNFRNRTLTSAGYLFALSGLAFTFFVQVLLKNPLWAPDDLGALLIFNGLLYIYGLPAFLAASLTWWLTDAEDLTAQMVSRLSTLASLLFFFLLVTLEIRHGFHGPVLAVSDSTQFTSTIIERGTYSAIWLLTSVPLLAIGRHRRAKMLTAAGYCFAIAGLAFTLVIEVLAQNPLWIPDNVGSFLIINRLLYIYGLPAIIAAVFARWFFNAQDSGARTFARFNAVVSIVLLFVLVSLEVRQGFQGNLLNSSMPPESAEMYAYSAAWGLYGTILLVAGIVTRGPILRWASLAVMLITIIKVFIFDTANLSDIFRVFSFAGLGLSLILLGFLYHYFVFRRPPASIPPTGSDVR